jgi:hypothetical protein
MRRYIDARQNPRYARLTAEQNAPGSAATSRHAAPMAGNPPALTCQRRRKTAMSDDQIEDEERPCLHCLIVELIDNFFAEYPVSNDEPDAVDTDEVITAVAKTVAELTCSQDAAARQKMIEQLTREVLNYDAEYRQQDELGEAGSGVRH